VLTNQDKGVSHGGHREGAGRPIGPSSGTILSKSERAERIARLESIGALGATSKRVMHALGDAAYWLEIIDRLEGEENWDKIVAVLMFHQQMRDGRPAQQINVTSQSITFSADELMRARGVARGLVAARQLEGEVLVAPVVTNELTAEHNVGTGQGAKKDG
jgi:hypothetical protein